MTTRSESEITTDSTGAEGGSDFRQTSSGSDDDDVKKEVVFIYSDGKAKIQEVKTGISDYDNIEILEGLAAGDKVVSGPFLAVSSRLKNGDAITDPNMDDGKGDEAEGDDVASEEDESGGDEDSGDEDDS